jgi:hypothetical protein
MANKRKAKFIVKCKNPLCQNIKYLPPSKAKTFLYCSNECKWEAKKDQIPVNKIPEYKKIELKCLNVFCQKKFYKILPSHLKRKRQYCSNQCKMYIRTDEYKIRLDVHLKIDAEKARRSIWFL